MYLQVQEWKVHGNKETQPCHWQKQSPNTGARANNTLDTKLQVDFDETVRALFNLEPGMLRVALYRCLLPSGTWQRSILTPANTRI